MYILQCFGIPVDYIPISFTGKVKEKYVKEWIRLRQLLEDERLTPSWTAQSKSNMIESPYLDDIIFRNGTSLLSHPGNILLRSTIATNSMHEDKKHKNTKDFVSEIIAEIKARGSNSTISIDHPTTASEKDSSRNTNKDGCRFLIWNEKGWWEQVPPENELKQIHSKISRIVRDTRKLVTATQKKEVLESANSASASTTYRDPSVTDRQSIGGAYTLLQSESGMSQKRQKLSRDGGDCFGIQICDTQWSCTN